MRAALLHTAAASLGEGPHLYRMQHSISEAGGQRNESEKLESTLKNPSEGKQVK